MSASAPPAAAPTDCLLIFARPPELGRVKTRLAAGIGAAAALAVYQELLAITRAAAAGLPTVAKAVWLVEAAAPAAPDDGWQGYPQQVQPAGDLGQRMQHAFAAAFAAGAGRVVIIGTDCPDLTTELLTGAFAQLAHADVVIGPATDGGYYLLGLRRPQPALFEGKAWSTAAVLPATLADARRLGLTVALLPALRDVDTAADLAAWKGDMS